MEKLVFNARKWNNKDVGDNSQFWEKALLLHVYEDEKGRELATVLWEDGNITTGHFTDGMKEV